MCCYYKDFGGCSIEILKECDIDAFMLFMSDNLSVDSILAKSRAFIKKQFYRANEKCYNFLVAKSKKTKEIIGVLGFVDTYFYEARNLDENFTWFTNWLVKKTAEPIVGIQLLYSAYQLKTPSLFGAVGLSDIALSIYKKLRYRTGELTQYYMQNPEKKPYLITGSGKNGSEHCFRRNRRWNIEIVKNSERTEIGTDAKPQKSLRYLYQKYCLNAFYPYELYSVAENTESRGYVVLKEDQHNGVKALRIVDFIGDEECFRYGGSAFYELMVEREAEFLDCYCYGIDPKNMVEGGFLQNEMTDEIVVPCYFEPFCRANIPIHFAYQLPKEARFTVFKGDGDREFPRILDGYDDCGRS